MKKLLAIIIAMTLIFSCIAIPASAVEVQNTQTVASDDGSSEGIFDSIKNLPSRIAEFFRTLLNGILSLFGSESEEPEAPKPYLVPQEDKEDTIVINRDDYTVSGFVMRKSKVEDIPSYVKVNDESLGYIEVIPVREGSRYAGTGSTINVIDKATNEIVESFTIIIYGDINGDAHFNAGDSSLIKSEVKGDYSWSDETSDEYSYASTKAADLNQDGAITKEDEELLIRVVAGIYTINQTTREVVDYSNDGAIVIDSNGKKRPYLVAQDDKEDTIVINREDYIVHGFARHLKKVDIGNYIKVNDDTIGKLEFEYPTDYMDGTGSTTGTGTKIKVIDIKTNEVVETFTIIFFGDIDGNGRETATDTSIIQMEADGESSWSDKTSADYSYYKTLAADLDKDGAITQKDVNLHSECISRTYEINQTTGEVVER